MEVIEVHVENNKDEEAYNNNMKVFSGGLDKTQVADYYNTWVEQYEQVRNNGNNTGQNSGQGQLQHVGGAIRTGTLPW